MGRYNYLLAIGGAAAIFGAVGSYTHDVPVSLFDDHVITRLIFGIIGVTALRQSGGPEVTGPQRWNIPFASFILAIELVTLAHAEGTRAWGFYAATLAFWLLAWRAVDVVLAEQAPRGRAKLLSDLAVPMIFGFTLIVLWEVLARGLQIPMVILPAPSAILGKLFTSLPILGADFLQTVQGILAGYVIGCGAGILVAILIDRVPFLQRGLLPLGNLVSALPIVGVAPIMVMWFGFDWQSKAAVVVIMTFFPQLVNTVAGLAAAGAMERDLMKTYAASYGQTLFALRLPSALPFIFNGLKINSTLALIGAIVAEFFGTPIVGMGFRINTEVGRMNIDMVWATIVVAALCGSLFYGILAFIEKRITFWHASYRQGA